MIEAETLSLATLPAIKDPLEAGIFCGLITLPDGTHHAVVLLEARPDKRLTWKKAQEWAASVDGVLPTRPVAALLYSLAKDLIEPDWYWTSEANGKSYAWCCIFYGGYQGSNHQGAEGAAVAVRLIPLTA